MLINASYFVNELLIPNLAEGYEEGYDIESLIQDCSHSFLESFLGVEIYKELLDNLTADQSELKPNADEKWEDLVNGCDYEHNGKTRYFKGLVYKRGTIPKSLLAQYVYIKYIEQNTTQLTPTGDVRPNSQNAINVNSSQRYADAWNNFLKSVRGDLSGFGSRCYYHNGVLIIDHYKAIENETPSLMQYLIERKDVYGNARLLLPENESFNYRNSLGL